MATSFPYLLILLSFAAMQSVAAEQEKEPPTAEKWFQTELVIFKRIQRGAGQAEAETWPVNIELTYPENVVWLIDLDTADENNIDPLIADDTATARDSANHERPYILLPKREMGLLDSAAAIHRHADMDVLFHQAWRQAIVEPEKALSIVISGGQKFDDHYELEGSVQLSLSRYLHLKTNLWLTEFTLNNQPESAYSRYSTKKETCTAPIDNDDANTSRSSRLNTDCIGAINHWPTLPDRPEPMLFNNENESDEVNDTFLPYATSSTAVNSASTPPSKYVVNRIATLNQSRRMRSNELHYIDHPKIGIIIRIKPYQRKTTTPITNSDDKEQNTPE